ncbi:MAG TPA: hypothetical protein VM307_11215 [Egibacteraceae bacterium]|nr:hypothetical protein [Egibacteraceae bacterium]
MVRTARPSDVYRLPPAPAEASSIHPPSPQPAKPRRRPPAWMAVAGVLALVLVIAGLVRGTTMANTGDAGLVDVVSEDQAIAALALYDAQAATMQRLRDKAAIYENPGPPEAVRIAASGSQRVQQALDDARALPNPDTRAAAYYNAGGHSRVVGQLVGVTQLAEAIALLSATHDSLYGGAGSIPLPEAYDRINNLLASRRGLPEPLALWGQALLEQMEDRNRAQQAATGRQASQRVWAATVRSLRPAAVRPLAAYLQTLPSVTIEGLRGHPVAGPGLRRLEQR